MITDNYSNEKLLKRYELIGRNKNLTERTIEAQRYDLKLFDWQVGKPFEEVTHVDVEDFLFYCQSERGNKDAALNRKFASLNKFFQTMVKKDYLKMANPMDKLEPIKVRKKLLKYCVITLRVEMIIFRLFSFLDMGTNYRGNLYKTWLKKLVKMQD